MEDLDYQQFVKRIKDSLTLDLSSYKETQMKRRLTSLRLKRGFTNFAAFYDALMKDEALRNEFLDRVTINVSEFWRNPVRWSVLERKFIPELVRRSPRLKCWSAACSTGEEPYTLAMILAEQGIQNSDVLATDIDENVLAKARIGEYPERSVRDVPELYRRKYFKEEGGVYRIDESLKRMVRFRKGDLLTDRFDSDYDLIICRNVMIYFTESAKVELYHKFAQALKPGGILFVGSTEQIFTPAQYGLESADTFFYRRMPE